MEMATATVFSILITLVRSQPPDGLGFRFDHPPR